MDDADLYEPLYAFVRSIPTGKVVTYGQAADSVTTVRLTARMAGAAMRVAPEDVPWQRVVGASGRLRTANRSIELMLRQRDLLLLEGVQFTSPESNVIDMRQSQWIPDLWSAQDADPFQKEIK
jgi:methylated-DNA-protein-cysteine methyltransferase related protein